MAATNPKYTVSWGPNEGSVAISQKGEVKRVVGVSELPQLPLLIDARVSVNLSSGYSLINVLARMLRDYHISRLSVRSYDQTARTVVGDVEYHTLNAWGHTPNAHSHPVIKTLTPYLPCGDVSALYTLIGAVFDPRWFHDHMKPGSRAQLESFLQLTPRWDHSNSTVRSVVTGCWMAPNTYSTNLLGPRDYYGRRFVQYTSAGVGRHAALRKVGREFAKALHAAWLDAYMDAADDKRYRGDRMFVPELLYDKETWDASGR